MGGPEKNRGGPTRRGYLLLPLLCCPTAAATIPNRARSPPLVRKGFPFPLWRPPVAPHTPRVVIRHSPLQGAALEERKAHPQRGPPDRREVPDDGTGDARSEGHGAARGNP